MAPLPDEARCHAVLKSTWRWRCSRAATNHGLCSQHFYFGCKIPLRWNGENNPSLPYFTWYGDWHRPGVVKEKNLALLDYALQIEDGELVVVL